MQEFTTAVKAAESEDDKPDLEFNVDGVLVTAYYPGDGQLAYLMASTGKHQPATEQVAGLINFFVAVLDDESHGYIVNKLLDRKDPFGLEEVQDIFEWMVEQWAGRPTKQPSDFASSRRSAGPKSKSRTPARR